VAVPFTPVPGSAAAGARRCARGAGAGADRLVRGSKSCRRLHVLFAMRTRHRGLRADAGLMQRHRCSFIGQTGTRRQGRPYASFDDFLASLSQDKRKKIRQERRKVAEAGVRFRWARAAPTSRRRTGTFSTAATSAPTWSTATRPT
jgi:predicted N-acyltransferase